MWRFGSRPKPAAPETLAAARAGIIAQGVNYILTMHHEGGQVFSAFKPGLTQAELNAAGLDGLSLLRNIGEALSNMEPPVAAHIYEVPTGRNTLGNIISTKAVASVIAVGEEDMRTDPPAAEREDIYVPGGYSIEPAAVGINALARRSPATLDQAAISLAPNFQAISLGLSPLGGGS